MTEVNGYKCDVAGCEKFIDYGDVTHRHSYGAKKVSGWYQVNTLEETNDPHVCSLDHLITWAEQEKKRLAAAKKKRKPSAKKAAPKKSTRRRVTSRNR